MRAYSEGARGTLWHLPVACAVLLLGYFSWQVEAHYVPATSSTQDIQWRIDQAEDGAVIYLGEGSWTVNLRITKSLKLRGSGAGTTILRARDPREPVLSITSTGIESITVEVTGISFVDAIGHAGVYVAGLVVATISDCSIEANAFGLIVDSHSVADIRTCTLQSNGAGVALVSTGKAAIISCQISRNSLGLRAHDQSELFLSSCIIEENNPYDGIWLTDSTKATDIDNCIVRCNGDDGIELRGDSTARITRCVIDRNGSSGINLIERPVVTIEGSTIQDNGEYGVRYEDGYPEYRFEGFVSGKENTIPEPTDTYGNKAGSVYPLSLVFLTTPTGGHLDLRRGIP